MSSLTVLLVVVCHQQINCYIPTDLFSFVSPLSVPCDSRLTWLHLSWTLFGYECGTSLAVPLQLGFDWHILRPHFSRAAHDCIACRSVPLTNSLLYSPNLSRTCTKRNRCMIASIFGSRPCQHDVFGFPFRPTSDRALPPPSFS